MKYQIAIIGGGPAGYTAAEAAGKAGLSVVLFEGIIPPNPELRFSSTSVMSVKGMVFPL